MGCTTHKEKLQELRRRLKRCKINVVIPSSLLNFESVNAKTKPGHTAHDVLAYTPQSKSNRREHVSRPGLQHTYTHHTYLNHPAIYRTRPSSSVSILDWESTPVMTCEISTVQVLRMVSRELPSESKMSRPEAHHKLA
eukprot:257983-Pelagomonas_calceolata.AAC.2